MSKTIYLGTTYKCSACKCQERLIKMALVGRSDIQLIVCDYKELPKWISNNVKLTDFPVTILIEDDIVKYHFVGTKTVSKIKDLFHNINY